jgi:hypothetical protein
MKPLHVDEATRWQRRLFGSTYRTDPYAAVGVQLRQRDASYIHAWEREQELDLHIAFKIAAIIKRARDWPNDFFLPDDPFALVNPLSNGVIDDLNAVACVSCIETALGLRELPESFWIGAYKRCFADVLRFLEAEMSARRRW